MFTSWESNHKITLPSAATNTARSYEVFSNVNRFSRMSSYHNDRKMNFRHSYLASGRPLFICILGCFTYMFSIIRLLFPKFRIHCTCICKGNIIYMTLKDRNSIGRRFNNYWVELKGEHVLNHL